MGRDKAEASGLPLPICCEICPRRQGAFLRTDVQCLDGAEDPIGKWVHSTCAKWHGLHFVRVPDIVEDVRGLKSDYRARNIVCHLCQGERGCMIMCRIENCNKWLHITCARAVGTCEIVHGEDVNGELRENAWSLLCPDHSHIKQIPQHAISIESLVQAAKEFPPDEKPASRPILPKPFDTATGLERKLLLLNRSYENALMHELTRKRINGVRCEVCDQDVTENLKLKKRCRDCGVVFCGDCSLRIDDEDERPNYRCTACTYVITKTKSGERFDPPKCVACCQKGGWLRIAKATCVKKGTWKRNNPRQFQSTFFAKDNWCHSICAM
jgi:hypothetical protein